MKKIKKVAEGLLLSLIILRNTCFADVVMSSEDIKAHGMIRREMQKGGLTGIFKILNIISIIAIPIFIVLIIAIVIIVIVCINSKKENDK